MTNFIIFARTRPIVSIGAPWLIVVMLWVGAFLPACRGAQSNAQPPQTPAAVSSAPDAGLPAPAPSRRGVMMPSDTGIGAMPSGTGPTTGTAGRSTSPMIGNSGGGGN